MSASGILRPNEVIFYHPLDDFTEHTQDQLWSGVGEFVSGKIDNANSAAAIDSASFGAKQQLGSDTGVQVHTSVDNLTGSKMIVSYSEDGVGMAKVITISGSTFTTGSGFAIPDATTTQGVCCTALSSDIAVFSYRKSTTTARAIIGQISGNNIAFGSSVVAWTGFWPCPIKLTSTKFVLIGSKLVGGDRDHLAAVGEVSGLTITMGSPITVSASTSAQRIIGHNLNSSGVLVAYTSTSTTGLMCRTATASGLDLILGDEYQIDALGSEANASIKLTSTKFLTLYAQPKGYGIVGSISGTNITFGSPVLWTPYSKIEVLSAASLDSTHAACIHSKYGTPECKIATVSGTNVTFADGTSLSPLDDDNYLIAGPVDSTTFFVVGSDNYATEAAVGMLDTEGVMTAQTPGAYPSTTGDTRIVVAMWAENLTNNSSTVTVERGYIIDITATGISLGGTTAIWNDAGISAIMSVMNDGSDHLLVLDFENVSGTNWNLLTSIDGQDFVEQGSQNSGTQIITTTDTAPKLEITDGASGQWIDELVMWAGDKSIFEHFTSEELINLHNLADILNKGMDQYDEGLFTIQSSCYLLILSTGNINESSDLFIKCHHITQASGNLFLKVLEPHSASGDLFIAGPQQITVAGDLFIGSNIEIETSGNLFILGHENIAISGDFFINGYESRSTSGNLFIYGHISNVASGDLFINGYTIRNEQCNLFVYGHDTPDLYINGIGFVATSSNFYILAPQQITNSGNLFIGGPELLSTSGFDDLFIYGMTRQGGGPDLFTKGYINYATSCDFFVCGGGIVSENKKLNLFINGYEPKPALACPILDPTASIQIKDSLIRIYQSRIDALINQLGKNVYLEFDPIRDPCPNCEYDVIRKRSIGIYKSGGPRPFARGRKCPYCKGRGFTETAVNKCIKCLIKWNSVDAENFGIAITQRKGIVRLKTFLTEADDLMRAKTIIVNHDIVGQIKLKVRLIQGPIPVGLREDRYCISFWELI